jgi:hypothetical protein
MLEAPLNHFHRPQAHLLRLPAEAGQVLIAEVQSSRFCRPVHYRHTAHLWTGQRCRRHPLSRRVHHCATILRRTGHIAGQRRRAQNTPVVNHRPAAREITHPGTTRSIYCDTSAGRYRPYVPASLRLQVFQSVHDLSHSVTTATAKLVAQRFVWPGVQNDCRTWARACQSSQRCKVSCHIFTPLGDFKPPVVRFLHVHIDLVGPLPTSADCTYYLTSVDHFTRRPEVFLIPDITGQTVWHSDFANDRPPPRG